MAAVLQRTKKWIYIFAASVALMLLGVRGFNAWQKTSYVTEKIENIGNATEASISFPKTILSSKTEALYPLTITFINRDHPQPAVDYDFIFESSTVVFTDSSGNDVEQHLKISSNTGSIQRRVFIRPTPSGNYPSLHNIHIAVQRDGTSLATTPATITIQSEPWWTSYLTLIASSILEISIVLGLATLVTKALDDEQKARRDLMDQRRSEIQKLTSLPLLPQMRQYLDLRAKQLKEQWEEELNREFVAKEAVFSKAESERVFLQTVGDCLVQGRQSELTDMEILYGQFHSLHQQSVHVVAKIILRQKLTEDPLWLVSQIVMLWDDFDADVKDLIVAVLVELSQQMDLSQLSGTVLKEKVFYDNNKTKRLRLLRSVELRRVFPQLITPPADYDAIWFHQRGPEENGKVSAWLKQHYLVSNPFGGYDLKNYPFFPSGARRPDQWLSFLSPTPLLGLCPSAEDVQPLTFRLRDECLRFGDMNKSLDTWQHIFPVMVPQESQAYLQQPLVTLCHGVARSWLSILPMSPDALLDLPLITQERLLDLLCWSLGSKYAAISLLQQYLPGENAACRLLKSKFTEYNAQISPVAQPPDVVLLSWLRIRPPDLERTYLIFAVDDRQQSTIGQWFEYFCLLIPTLALDGIVTKVVSAIDKPFSKSLAKMELTWFANNEKTRKYLDGQFDAAMDPLEISLGKEIRFHELFGPGTKPEETTDRLIAASECSLAKLLRLGNRLFQIHCEREKPEKYLSPEELDDILLKKP